MQDVGKDRVVEDADGFWAIVNGERFGPYEWRASAREVMETKRVELDESKAMIRDPRQTGLFGEGV